MIRRVLIAIPILALFICSSVVFMAAHAPRTWAAHWAAPRQIGTASAGPTFAAVPAGGGLWDLLWYDDAHRQIRFGTHDARGALRSVVLDHGDVQQPTLARIGTADVGAWVHNRNGATDLFMAISRPGRAPHTFRLLGGSAPLEHPYLFVGASGRIDLVFSWQKYGNYDLFFASLPLGSRHPAVLRRLTRARYYSFYPRAVADASGTIHLLHFESCCQQQDLNVIYDRLDRNGARLGRSRVLYQITSLGPGRTLPAEIGADMVRDPHGHIWGAFSGDGGVDVFEVTSAGNTLHAPKLVMSDGTVPNALSLVTDGNGGFVFWEEPVTLGKYLSSQHFSAGLTSVGGPERVDYVAAVETNPHAVLLNHRPQVLWEATPVGKPASFQITTFEKNVQPSLAQKLGLGLGDPWFELLVLVVTAFGLAVATTVANLLVVFALAGVGIIAARFLRRLPFRWAIYALLVAVVLYLTFVRPGGPIIFLDTLPNMGLSSVTLGVFTTMAALALMLWMSALALKRLDDMYRAGIMAVVGIYFFAYLEAVVFVQQRLGYI